MVYHFFDYKYNIDGYHGQDFDSPYRLIFTVVALVSAFLIAYLCRKEKKENIIKYIRIAAISLTILEVTKVIWESYWDVKTGRGLDLGGFNASGVLSLETCSLFMYVGIVAGFTKNEKVRRACIDWLISIGFVAGLSNILLPQGLKYYPFWTFGAFHNMIYHYVLVLTALIIVFNRFYSLTWNDIIQAYIPHLVFSSIVITIDYITKWNYMLYRDPSAFPVIRLITDKLTAKGLYFVNTIIVLIMFLFLDALFMSIYIGVYKAIDVQKEKKKLQTE